MVEISDNVMQLARDIARLVRARIGSDARVVLFGSWAKGTAFPRSDIDIAVAAGGPIRPAKLERLTAEFESLRTLRKIDLVDVEAAGSELRAEILAHGIEL